MSALRPTFANNGRSSVGLSSGPVVSARPLPFESPASSPLYPTSHSGGTHAHLTARSSFVVNGSTPDGEKGSTGKFSDIMTGLSPGSGSPTMNMHVYPTSTHTATSQAGNTVVSSASMSHTFAVTGRNLHPQPRSAGRSASSTNIMAPPVTTAQHSTVSPPLDLKEIHNGYNGSNLSGAPAKGVVARISSAKHTQSARHPTSHRIASAVTRHTSNILGVTSDAAAGSKVEDELTVRRSHRRQPSPSKYKMSARSDDSAYSTASRARNSVYGTDMLASTEIDQVKEESVPSRVRLKCLFNGETRLTYLHSATKFENFINELSESYGFRPTLRYNDPVDDDLIVLANQKDLDGLLLSLSEARAAEDATSLPTVIVQVFEPPKSSVADTTETSGASEVSSGDSGDEKSVYKRREVFAAAGSEVLQRPQNDDASDTTAAIPPARLSNGTGTANERRTSIQIADHQPSPPPKPPATAAGAARPRLLSLEEGIHTNVAASSVLRKVESAPYQSAGSFRWKRGDEVGRGAFGVVYLGLKDTGELMAVKQLDTRDISARELNDVEHEIEVLRSLDHDNIVKYYGTQRTEGILSIFLEYAPGGSIRQILSKFGALEERVIRTYTRQLLLGLEYLHAHGIAHRDIKGGNVLVAADGTVKLADFGASQKVGSTTGAGTGTQRKPLRSGRTEDTEFIGGLAGTPFWMAPEAIKESTSSPGGSSSGAKLWKKADIWSVGCTVIEMATGRPPWSELENEMTAMFVISSADALPAVPEHLSSAAKDFVRMCLQKDPVKRPGVAQLLLHPFVAPAPASSSTQGAGKASRMSGSVGSHNSSLLTVRPSTSSGTDRDVVSQKSLLALQQRIHMRALLEEDERLREQEQHRSAERRVKSLRSESEGKHADSQWGDSNGRIRAPSASVLSSSHSHHKGHNARAHTAAGFHAQARKPRTAQAGAASNTDASGYSIAEVEAEFGQGATDDDDDDDGHDNRKTSKGNSNWNDRAVLDSLRFAASSPASEHSGHWEMYGESSSNGGAVVVPRKPHATSESASKRISMSQGSNRSDGHLRPASQASARVRGASPSGGLGSQHPLGASFGWRHAASPFEVAQMDEKLGHDGDEQDSFVVPHGHVDPEELVYKTKIPRPLKSATYQRPRADVRASSGHPTHRSRDASGVHSDHPSAVNTSDLSLGTTDHDLSNVSAVDAEKISASLTLLRSRSRGGVGTSRSPLRSRRSEILSFVRQPDFRPLPTQNGGLMHDTDGSPSFHVVPIIDTALDDTSDDAVPPPRRSPLRTFDSVRTSSMGSAALETAASATTGSAALAGGFEDALAARIRTWSGQTSPLGPVTSHL